MKERAIKRSVTSGLPVQTPAPSFVVSLGTSPALPADGGQRARWRRLYGSLTDSGSAVCINGWMSDFNVKSSDLIKHYTSAGHLPCSILQSIDSGGLNTFACHIFRFLFNGE
ncbi:hypothetical protein ATANTOWER_015768 [Ataeniobius toweri]|uniref:Uncharacterized protein n=1 Tax=Ataeniobius toweri TaxID=208326 RepID=A0ABU7B217_9TELE|nr:hypothetical protein [Ataeniobius toweri]